jgi:hypothetical protein
MQESTPLVEYVRPAPALVIRLELEGRLRVWLETTTESEEVRVLDWINSQHQLAEVVCSALEAGDEQEAA